MMEVWAIARNTFKEAIRNRILYIILIFSLLLIAISGVLSELSIIDKLKVIRSLGFTSIDFFAVAIAVFVGVSLVYNELEKKSIYTIVSKPIGRGHFIVGKYIGLLATVFVNVVLMTFCFLIALHYYGDDWENSSFLAALGGSFVRGFLDLICAGGAYASTANVMQVIGVTCLELMIVTAFSVLYSSFSTPTLSMIFTVLTFIAGRLNEDIIRFSEQIFNNAFTEAQRTGAPLHLPLSYYFAKTASYVVPNLGAYSNSVTQAIYEPAMHIWWGTVAYGLLYTTGVICLAILIFMRRNFK
jgi:ABC-type transport system involved in multi-copper enzyme maturation permease subunit